jgi:hypothetical protein
LPLIRFVALCEIGTRVLFAARMAAWKISEVALAKQLMDRLEPGMLCLADRLFYGFELWNQAVATGAQLLWRVQKSISLPRLDTLSDGSYLSEVRARSNAPIAVRARRLPVRVIEFTVTVGRKRKHYRVITTLLDPRKASASELANLYAKRWGIETAFDEVKTHLKGSGVLLRSQRPENKTSTVFFWPTSAFARSWRKRHATKASRPPSFPSSMPCAWSSAGFQKWFPFPPSGGSRTLHRRLLAEVGEERNPLRPDRHYPRVKKRPPYRYPYPSQRRTVPPTHQVALVEIAL